MRGKSLILLGENGTGKSSFVDGLEWAFTGRVRPLEERGQRVSFARHGPHVQAAPDQAMAEVVLTDETVLNPESDRAGLPPDVIGLLVGARAGGNILRRAQLLEVVNAQPADRYGLLRPLLPLETIEAWEDATRAARGVMEADRRGVETELARLEAEFKSAGSFETSAEEDILRVLNERASPSGLDPCRRISDAGRLAEEALTKLKVLGEADRLTRIHLALESLNTLLTRTTSLDSYITLVRSIEEHRTSIVMAASTFYEDVLNLGRRWITEDGLSECPLCEQRIPDLETLLARIEERLAENADLTARRRRLAEEQRRVCADLEAWQRDARTCDDRVRASALQITLDSLRITMELTDRAARCLQKPFLELELRGVSVEEIPPGDLTEELIAARRVVAEAIDALPQRDAIEALFRLQRAATATTDFWPRLLACRARLQTREARLALADAYCQTLEDSRKEHVQSVFAAIESDARTFYEMIHPDEATRNIRLEVRDVGQGSALLSGDFAGRAGEDPRGYYSDSHLDTLGLCLFLAFYKRQSDRHSALRILVLDDVLTSVDAPHRRRTARLLLSEFRDHQILITTHDKTWFRELREVQSFLGIRDRFLNLEIREWSLEEGPRVIEPRELADQLRDSLVSNDEAAAIAGAAGRLLEFMLQNLHRLLRIPVEGKPNDDYTIADIWDPLLRRVRRDDRPQGLYESGRGYFENLALFGPIRNALGGHYNDWAESISRVEVLTYSRAVLGIWDLVYCEQCFGFIMTADANRESAACRGGHLRYPRAGA